MNLLFDILTWLHSDRFLGLVLMAIGSAPMIALMAASGRGGR